jgi:site-specific recombinase XerD
MLNKVSSVNAVFNKNLKRIAEDAGIEKHVTFHVSRHTFATMALQENIDSMTIKGALAHASLQTTETYLQEFNMTAIDKTLQRVFDQKPDIDNLLAQINKLSDDERKLLLKKVMPKSGARI